MGAHSQDLPRHINLGICYIKIDAPRCDRPHPGAALWKAGGNPSPTRGIIIWEYIIYNRFTYPHDRHWLKKNLSIE